MKTFKRLALFAFIAILAVSGTFSTSASAAGVETWYGDWKDEPTITVTNNNLTPVKTMGVSGTLHLACGFHSRPDLEPAGCPKIQVTMQIRDLNGKVLKTQTTREDAFLPQVHLTYAVKKGQKIQVFFDVSSVSYNPNRNYRVADISYSHEIY